MYYLMLLQLGMLTSHANIHSKQVTILLQKVDSWNTFTLH